LLYPSRVAVIPVAPAASGPVPIGVLPGICYYSAAEEKESVEMKGLIVFDTSHGNTRKIAETISDTLKELGIANDVFYVRKAKNLSAKDYAFLILGSPTKFWTMSLATWSFLGRVKRKEWANKPFATFDTEDPVNIERKRGSAAEKIARQLARKQMRQLMPALKAIVLDWKGPLKEGEIERTKEYARELAAKLKQA
jgi:menaquinone-dependent protoporphyrinogen IX oxidase